MLFFEPESKKQAPHGFSDCQSSQAAGFDAYLTKPVNYEAIMGILAQLSTGTRGESPREPVTSTADEPLAPPGTA
jgi:hypothetical protein